VVTNCIDNTTADLSSSFSLLHPLSLIDTSIPFFDRSPRRLKGLTDDCDNALNQMYIEIGNDINQYDIYVPCISMLLLMLMLMLMLMIILIYFYGFFLVLEIYFINFF
jgi:hypothetical protein